MHHLENHFQFLFVFSRVGTARLTFIKDKIEVLCVLVWCPVSFVDLDILITDPNYR